MGQLCDRFESVFGNKANESRVGFGDLRKLMRVLDDDDISDIQLPVEEDCEAGTTGTVDGDPPSDPEVPEVQEKTAGYAVEGDDDGGEKADNAASAGADCVSEVPAVDSE